MKLMRALEAVWSSADTPHEEKLRAVRAVRAFIAEAMPLFETLVESALLKKESMSESYHRKNLVAAGLKPPPKKRRGNRKGAIEAGAVGAAGQAATGRKRKRAGPDPSERLKPERASLLIGRLVEDDMDRDEGDKDDGDGVIGDGDDGESACLTALTIPPSLARARASAGP